MLGFIYATCCAKRSTQSKIRFVFDYVAKYNVRIQIPSVSVGKMNDLKWNGKEIISFLNIFQNYPCLWDVQSDNYLNRNVKDESYPKLLEDLRIAEIPGTPELIKNKIRILRDTYRKKLYEFQKSNDGANVEVHKPKLIWFSAADVFIHRSATGESSSNMVSI